MNGIEKKGIIACVLVFLFLMSSVSVVSAGVPGDTDGNTLISRTELSSVIIPYMKVTYLGEEVEHLERGDLSVAAHNYLRLPFGRVVIPVDFAKDLIKGNILNKGGAPTSSIMYEGLITRNSWEGTYDGWLAESSGKYPEMQRYGRSI
jgi:peptide/nickel transport system substrate-binding protein